MSPELKAKWLEALRSGEYKQTTGVLKNNDGFCCLGVLCDVIDPTKWDDAYDKWTEGYGYNFGDNRHSVESLHYKTANELGLDKEYAGGSFVQLDDTLMDMNDNGKNTFVEIADFIEANL